MFSFEKTKTCYAIQIPEDDFLKLLDSESLMGTNDIDLGAKIGNMTGCLVDVEYGGHFGSYIYLSIIAEDDCKKFRNDLLKVIKSHIKELDSKTG